MKIALIQMDVALGQVQVNQEKAKDLIDKAITEGAKLIVLPELWTTGYKLDEIDKMAESENGQTIMMLRQIAKDNQVEIMTGSIAEARDGKVYNTSYAIDSAGTIQAKYSKIHLIGLMEEDKFIAAGNKRSTFTMSFGKAGMIICYDLRFTELSRALALDGCQTLFVSAEWPTVRGMHWRALNIARAIENQMYVIAVNRVGKDVNNNFFGHSMVIDPWGEVIAEGSETKEEVIMAEVDFTAVDEVRSKILVFADRRPECYELKS